MDSFMLGFDNARVSWLKELDYSVVQQCMHCGLCLPACPTYDATKNERSSPRGRIALMRSIADGELQPTREFAEEMYYCVGCLSCQTACPAGVNYAELIEHARAEVESGKALSNPIRSALRWFTLKWLFTDLRRLQLAGRVLSLYQELGLQELLRRSRLMNFLPRRLRELESMTPSVRSAFSDELIMPTTKARGPVRYRVALLTGCVQDILFSDVNRDTAEVLARHGNEVWTPPEQNCCGSLHAHNGELELARQLARRNIDQFPPDQFDAIITNAGGCGSHLKRFGALLSDDPVYSDRAAAWDRKVKDIHEWLVEIGAVEGKPAEDAPNRRVEKGETIVAYHDSCHLHHGQRVVDQPRALLRMIPGIRLVELAEPGWCCGSAGVYNLVQPDMANALLRRKIARIRESGATVIATANPGCLLQLLNGAAQEGLKLRVVFPITLLAEAGD